MAVACLIGQHRWQPLEHAEAPRLDPQQCERCGRTRIWNARDGAWMHGTADGLPADVVDYLAGGGKGDDSAQSGLPVADHLHYASGGGGFIIAGVIVAAMSLPLWFLAPAWAPKLALGLPLLVLGFALAAGRREVSVDRKRRTLVHRIRLWPLTLYRRAIPAKRLQKIRVAWEPNARVFAPRHGPRPHFLVRALGSDTGLAVAHCIRPKSARSIGRGVSEALDLPLEDKTREPGAPGT